MDGGLNVTARLSEKRILESFWNALGAPIRTALEGPDTIEIMINEDGVLWIETYSGMTETDVCVSADERWTVVRLLADKRETAANWELQAELIQTGDRFQAILPPAVPAPSMAIRKHRSKVIPFQAWIDEGRITEDQAAAMARCLAGKRGVLFGGSTGSGKTTLLNSSMLMIPETERVITIEDVREISIPHIRNKTQWLAIDGVVSMHELTKRTLRMRPDRIIIGEARDGKTLNEALKISLTGHKGTLLTTHATSAIKALSRMDHLISEVSMTPQRELVASVFGLVVFLENRRVTEVLEVFPCVKNEYSYSVLY